MSTFRWGQPPARQRLGSLRSERCGAVQHNPNREQSETQRIEAG